MDINELILFETVVEKLFDIFKDDFQLRSEYKNFAAFESHIKSILEKFKININFLGTIKQNSISGEYFVVDNSIIIQLPVRRFSLQEIISVIFHEFAHYIIEDRVPERFNPENKTDLLRNYTLPVKSARNKYGIYGLFLEERNSNLLMNQMLKYWTQPHERSNFAFSIAYDVYDENHLFEIDIIDKLINSHLECWKKFHADNNLEYLDKYMKSINKVGSLILFDVVFYRQELTSNRELSREMLLNVPRLLELIKKYYRRIVGILSSVKNSRTYFQV
jgi:hypothetical protein